MRARRSNIDPEQPEWRLTSSGGIVQDGNQQNLALVQPRSLGDLSKVGDNLFKPLAPPPAVADAQRRVLGGYLEQSDVKPTSEMMELIEASRAFEANISMIKNQDAMATALTERLLLTPS